MAALLVAGYCQISFVATANNRIQTLTPDHLRGRVMSLYAQALIGVGPLGSTQAGALAQWLGAPWAMAIGAVVAGAVLAGIAILRPEVFAPLNRPSSEAALSPGAGSAEDQPAS
jgi:MFS family permease